MSFENDAYRDGLMYAVDVAEKHLAEALRLFTKAKDIGNRHAKDAAELAIGHAEKAIIQFKDGLNTVAGTAEAVEYREKGNEQTVLCEEQLTRATNFLGADAK